MRSRFPATWFAAALLLHGVALAAEPSVPECLAASEASLKAGNERKRLEERSELLRCAGTSCPSLVRDECARRLDEVNRLMPTVLFDVRSPADERVNEVKISVDGQALSARVDDKPVPLDPGEHLFVFEVTGHPAVTQRFVIREAEKDRAIRVQIGSSEPGASVTPKGDGASERGGSAAQETSAWIAAGVGAVGLGVGGVFGALAWSKKRHANELCANACSTDAGVEAWNDARRAGNISTIAFAAGGVAVATAAVLWLTLPAAPSSRVEVGLGSVSVKGSF